MSKKKKKPHTSSSAAAKVPNAKKDALDSVETTDSLTQAPLQTQTQTPPSELPSETSHKSDQSTGETERYGKSEEETGRYIKSAEETSSEGKGKNKSERPDGWSVEQAIARLGDSEQIYAPPKSGKFLSAALFTLSGLILVAAVLAYRSVDSSWTDVARFEPTQEEKDLFNQERYWTELVNWKLNRKGDWFLAQWTGTLTALAFALWLWSILGILRHVTSFTKTSLSYSIEKEGGEKSIFGLIIACIGAGIAFLSVIFPTKTASFLSYIIGSERGWGSVLILAWIAVLFSGGFLGIWADKSVNRLAKAEHKEGDAIEAEVLDREMAGSLTWCATAVGVSLLWGLIMVARA